MKNFIRVPEVTEIYHKITGVTFCGLFSNLKGTLWEIIGLVDSLLFSQVVLISPRLPVLGALQHVNLGWVSYLKVSTLRPNSWLGHWSWSCQRPRTDVPLLPFQGDPCAALSKHNRYLWFVLDMVFRSQFSPFWRHHTWSILRFEEAPCRKGDTCSRVLCCVFPW